MILRNKTKIMVVVVLGLILELSGQNRLILSIDEAKSTIRREIYGALLENWGRDIYDGLYVGKNSSIPNTNGMRNDIIEGFKECGLSTLEFPGGCFADEYHWQDGIGPVNQRPGGESRNGMGTDEYMELCRLINAEPYICANLKTGTPQEMEEWINYINNNPSHPEWHVKYWSMGNEPWGCGGEFSAGQFADQYAQFVEAVPEIEVKPMIRIAGAGHWGTDWVNAVFDRNPGKLEGFSVHRYLVNDWTDMAGPSINYTSFQFHQIIQLANDALSFIQSFDRAMDRYDPDKKIGLMYNEWGAWYQEITEQGYTFSQSTVRDALIAAIHLNIFNNYCERVHLACVAQPVNVIQALFLTDKNNQTRMVKTPVFYTFKLFKVHQKAKKIPVNLQAGSFNQNVNGTNFSYPYLTASASLDSTDKVNITISNSDLSNAHNLQIQIDGSTSYASVTGQIITASEVTAYNDFGQQEKVNIQTFASDKFSLSGTTLSAEVPSKSVILLTLTPVPTSVSPLLTRRSGYQDLSIYTKGERKIVIDFTAVPPTPVKLRLLGLDGSVVAEKKTFVYGNNLVWVPQSNSAISGMYVVHLETEGISKSQKIALLH
ncbi:MAG: hypothetical protein GXY77_05775 [Fibrobacter sp.]|nr:hypothetical protein [Fibrobacter sp.]